MPRRHDGERYGKYSGLGAWGRPRSESVPLTDTLRPRAVQRTSSQRVKVLLEPIDETGQTGLRHSSV